MVYDLDKLTYNKEILESLKEIHDYNLNSLSSRYQTISTQFFINLNSLLIDLEV